MKTAGKVAAASGAGLAGIVAGAFAAHGVINKIKDYKAAHADDESAELEDTPQAPIAQNDTEAPQTQGHVERGTATSTSSSSTSTTHHNGTEAPATQTGVPGTETGTETGGETGGELGSETPGVDYEVLSYERLVDEAGNTIDLVTLGSGPTVIIYGDVDGDGLADFMVADFDGNGELTDDEFLGVKEYEIDINPDMAYWHQTVGDPIITQLSGDELSAMVQYFSDETLIDPDGMIMFDSYGTEWSSADGGATWTNEHGDTCADPEAAATPFVDEAGNEWVSYDFGNTWHGCSEDNFGMTLSSDELTGEDVVYIDDDSIEGYVYDDVEGTDVVAVEEGEDEVLVGEDDSLFGADEPNNVFDDIIDDIDDIDDTADINDGYDMQ